MKYNAKSTNNMSLQLSTNSPITNIILKQEYNKFFAVFYKSAE